MASNGAFHEGELAVQKLAGVDDETSSGNASMLRPYMPAQHREFFSQLPFVIVATVDPSTGEPWTSIMTVPKDQDSDVSVAESPDDTTLILRSRRLLGDPLFQNMAPALNGTSEPPIGILGIMLHNRRRNRANGRVVKASISEGGVISLEVKIEQSFGNCPKYIQLRQVTVGGPLPPATTASDPADRPAPTTDHVLVDAPHYTLSLQMINIISNCDTFFIGSRHLPTADSTSPRRTSDGLDVSHRGGPPGFVRVLADRASLAFPDYKGNLMFQTLGNIQTDSLVGITIIGFDDAGPGPGKYPPLLYMTGKAEVLHGEAASAVYPGYPRCVVFRPTECITVLPPTRPLAIRPGAPLVTLPFTTKLVERSPFNPRSLRSGRMSAIATATLSKATALSPSVLAYEFSLSQPLRVVPGQHLALDFSKVEALGSLRDRIAAEMGHVDTFRGNDDLLRVWTVSAGSSTTWNAQGEWKTDSVTLTIKTKPTGLVTNFLQQVQRSNEIARARKQQPVDLVVEVLGASGEFTLFDLESGKIAWKGQADSSCGPEQTGEDCDKSVLFIAAGTGITPALALIRALRKLDPSVFATRKLKLHVVFVAPKPEELLLQLVWDEFLAPAARSSNPKVLEISADFIVTRDTVPKIRSAVVDYCPPDLASGRKAREFVENLASFGTLDHPNKKFGFSALPSSALIEALQGLPQLEKGIEVLLCGPVGFMGAVEAALDQAAANKGIEIEIRREEFSY